MASESEKIPPPINGDSKFEVDWSKLSILGVPYTDHDAVHDPFWKITGKKGGTEGDAGDLRSVYHTIQESDLYKASWYRMGAFICWIAPKDAFSKGWNFVLQDTEEPVEKELDRRLNKLTREWRIKFYVIKAVCLATALGRSLLYKYEEKRVGYKNKWRLRVCRIPQEFLEFVDGTNIIKKFKPLVGKGIAEEMLEEIDPKNAVLFVHDEDPLGNTYQGTPGHFAAYTTIMRAERVTRAWANLIENRGMGVFLVGIKQGNPSPADLEKYRNLIGNPGSRSMIFYPFNLMEIKVEEGIKPGFGYNETDERFTRHASMATGYPGMSMEGEKVGKVSGSKTDQDDMSVSYTSIQEMWEDTILRVYHMIEPDLTDVDFELNFKMSVEMDPLEEAQIKLTNLQSAELGKTIFTVNDVRAMINLPALDGEEGEKIYADHQRDFMVADMEAEVPFNESEDNEEPSTNIKKEKMSDTDSLLREGFRTNEINKILKYYYGSGLSPNDIGKIRKLIKEK